MTSRAQQCAGISMILGTSVTGCSHDAPPAPDPHGAASTLASTGAVPSSTSIFGVDAVPTTSRGGAAVFRLSCAAPTPTHCVALGDNMLAIEGVMSADQTVGFAQQTNRKCEAGDAPSCETLGELYLNGKGIPKDETRALSIFEKTCDHGNMRACLDTGALYATATGTTVDMARAKQLMDKACAGGEQTACENAAAIAPYSP
jgi:uncharacterized protein